MNLNKSFFVIFLFLSWACSGMESAEADSTESTFDTLVKTNLGTIIETLESADKALIVEIIKARYRAIETFAGILAQLRYIENANLDLSRDYLAEEFVKRSMHLEALTSQASTKVTSFFKLFDELCAQETDYSYQRIAPLLYAYYGNAKIWDTYFRSAISYARSLRSFQERISTSFSQLGIEGIKKQRYLSSLKRLVDLLNGNQIKAFQAFEKNFDRLFFFAENQKQFEQFHLLIRDCNLPSLKTNRSNFERFKAKFNLAHIDREEDQSYYRDLCKLDEEHHKLELEAQAIVDHAPTFKRLLEKIKVYSSSLFTSYKLQALTTAVCQVLKPEELTEIIASNTERKNYILDHKTALESMLLHHLIITCNFHYLNEIYHTIEQANPLQIIQNKLSAALTELQGVLATTDPQKQVALETIQCKVRKLQSIRNLLKEEVWKLVRRLYHREWNALIQSSKACIAEFEASKFLYDNCYTILDTRFTLQQHPEFTRELTAIFKDQVHKIIILEEHLIPYVVEIYKAQTKSSCLLHPLKPSKEKIKHTIELVLHAIKRVTATLLNQTSSHSQRNMPETIRIEEDFKEIEEERQQEFIVRTPLNLHAIPYEEHQKLKELTRKLFIPIVTKIQETETTIVLRAWRGYSSEENTTITLQKVRDPKRVPPECIILVDSTILKKAKDKIDNNWDRYHAFSFAIERDYLASCALVIQHSDPLVRQLNLRLAEDSYALCIQATVGSHNGYIVYLVKKSTRLCYHRFFHEL